jgi:hypothetical protein
MAIRGEFVSTDLLDTYLRDRFYGKQEHSKIRELNPLRHYRSVLVELDPFNCYQLRSVTLDLFEILDLLNKKFHAIKYIKHRYFALEKYRLYKTKICINSGKEIKQIYHVGVLA